MPKADFLDNTEEGEEDVGPNDVVALADADNSTNEEEADIEVETDL